MCPLYCPPLHVPLKVAREKRFPFLCRERHIPLLWVRCILAKQSLTSKQIENNHFFKVLFFDICLFMIFFGDCVLTVHSYYRPTSVVINETSCQFSFLCDTLSLSHCAPPSLYFYSSIVKDLSDNCFVSTDINSEGKGSLFVLICLLNLH